MIKERGDRGFSSSSVESVVVLGACRDKVLTHLSGRDRDNVLTTSCLDNVPSVSCRMRESEEERGSERESVCVCVFSLAACG